MPNGMELAQQLFGQFNTMGQQHAAAVGQGSEFILAIKKLQMAEERQKAELDMMQKTHELNAAKWQAENGLLQQQIKQLQFKNTEATEAKDRMGAAVKDLPKLFGAVQGYTQAIEKQDWEQVGIYTDEFSQLLQKPHAVELMGFARSMQGFIQTPPELLRAITAPRSAESMFSASEMLGAAKTVGDETQKAFSSAESENQFLAEYDQTMKGTKDTADLIYSKLKAADLRSKIPVSIDLSGLTDPEKIDGIMKAVMANSSGLSAAERNQLKAWADELQPLVGQYKNAQAEMEYQRQNYRLAGRNARGFAANVVQAGVDDMTGAALTEESLRMGQAVNSRILELRQTFEQMPEVQAARRDLALQLPEAAERIKYAAEALKQHPDFADLPYFVRNNFMLLLQETLPPIGKAQ